jgi:hypothetical protein
LAVAVARELQRRQPSPVVAVLFACFVVGFVYFFVREMTRPTLHPKAAFWGIAAVGGLAALWELWRGAKTAPRAELANLRYLEQAGQPYPRDVDSRPVSVSPAARVLAAVALFALYDLTYGGLTLVMDGKTLTLDGVAGRGALWAAGMVIVNLTVLHSAHERDLQKPTAGSNRSDDVNS